MSMARTADPDEKRTRTSSIYFLLKGEILNGGLLPSAKLKVRELGDTYSSGLSPVREALNRLTTEGLVHHSENRGFTVCSVSVSELMDLTRARCWLNDIGIRESINMGGAEWEEAVLLTCHRLGRTPQFMLGEASVPHPDWNSAHKAFHQALIGACGSPWLIDACSQLFDTAERYRSLARLAGISRSDPRDEHGEIMTASIERKADEAANLLIAHFRRTAELVRSVVGERAE